MFIVFWMISTHRSRVVFLSRSSHFRFQNVFCDYYVSTVVHSFFEEMAAIQVNAVYIADLDTIAFPNNYDEDSVIQRADFESILAAFASLANLFFIPSNNYYAGFYGYYKSSEIVRFPSLFDIASLRTQQTPRSPQGNPVLQAIQFVELPSFSSVG